MSAALLWTVSMALGADAVVAPDATAELPKAPVVVVLTLDPNPHTYKERCEAADAPVWCAYQLRFAQSAPTVPREDRLRTVDGRLTVRMFDELARGWEDPTSPTGILLRETIGLTEFPATDAVWSTGNPTPARLTRDDDTPPRVQRIHSRPAEAVGEPVRGAGSRPPTPPCQPTLTGTRTDDDGTRLWVDDLDKGVWHRMQWWLPCPTDPVTGDVLPQTDPDTGKVTGPPVPLQAAPPTVVLTGRFAQRMAEDQKPRPVDMMGADPLTGAAFFEEMLPVSEAAWHAGVQVLQPFASVPNDTRPVSCEALPHQLGGVTRLTEADRACAESLASLHMQRFEDELFHQVQRFAVPAAAPLAARVLGALGAMSAPPGAIPELPPIAFDELVAASQGQLDPQEMQDLPRAPYVPDETLRIDFDALPTFVAWEGLARMPRLPGPNGTRVLGAQVVQNALADEQLTLFGAPPMSRAGVPDLPPLERTATAEWLGRSGVPPSRRAETFAVYPHAALQHATETLLTERERARFEEWLLFQHLRYTVYPSRDPDPAVKVKAADLEKTAYAALVEVLALHGVTVGPVDQPGPDTVSPLAVCTEKNGDDALAEEVAGAITISQIFAVPKRATAADDPLWAARAELPFFAVDDPKRRVPFTVPTDARTPTPFNQPAIEPLMTLAGGIELYRASWTVWSGWHLLWGSQPDEDGVDSLVVRTAAFCEDTVLVPEQLLPTIVWEALREPGTETVLEQKLSDRVAPSLATRAWLDPLVEEPLRALAGEGGATIAMVVEKAYADKRSKDGWFRPEGPYALDTLRLPDDPFRFIEGNANAWVLPADPTLERLRLAPDYYPTGGVAGLLTEPAERKWARRTAAELWIDGALGGGIAYDTNRGGGLAFAPLIDANADLVFWRRDAARRAFTLSGGGHLSGAPDTAIRRATKAVPQLPVPLLGLDASVGLRYAPLPGAVRSRARKPVAWGDTRPSGRRAVGRTQFGGRAGYLLGTDAYTPIVHRVWAEPWVAWSVHPRTAKRGALNPYSPGLLIGPSLRGQMWPEIDSSGKVGIESFEVVLGLRSWWLVPRSPGGGE